MDKKARGFVFKKILQTNKILSSGSGVLIKRNVFNIVGFFDENLRFAEDWDMWIRIAEKFEVDYRDEKLARIRRHEESMSRHIYKVFLGDINFFNKWVPKLRGQHLIPLEWSDKIIFRIIKMPRRRGMIKELRGKMLPGVYETLFEQKFFSIYIYFIFFIIRRTFKVILHPYDLLKLRR